jgi:hypothetical protein
VVMTTEFNSRATNGLRFVMSEYGGLDE